MKSLLNRGIFQRAEFWIAVIFLIRLIGITNPPLEAWHSWRQVTGLMVARNFLDVDPNILYPRIDDHAGGTGIIGMELPLLSYLHYLLSAVFGYTHWYGRLINLVVSSLGLIFFHRIISRFFDTRISFAATVILGLSIWFSFSRKMMPDTFCISLIFIGMHYAIRFIDTRRFLFLSLYILFSSLSILAKVPAVIYLVVTPLFLLLPGIPKSRVFILGAISLVPAMVSYYWYFIWNPELARQSGTWYNLGSSFGEGFRTLLGDPGAVFEKFFFNSFYSYLAIFCSAAGFIMAAVRKNLTIILPAVLVFLVFLAYMMKSGQFFIQHNYYIIPFVPVMALTSGYAVSLLPRKWMFPAVLFIIAAESIINQHTDFYSPATERFIPEIAELAEEFSNRDDLIAVISTENPKTFYFTRRKGWIVTKKNLENPRYLKQITKQGCKLAIVSNRYYREILPYPILFADDHFTVYDLGDPLNPGDD